MAGVCGSGGFLGVSIPQGNATFDAATANMGSHWKMPTSDQCQELINETTPDWITLNGKNGYKFINKKDSTKYIFITTPGYYQNAKLYDSNAQGNYWSTTYYSFAINSHSPVYLRVQSNALRNDYTSRYVGLSVRAIQ